jgi:prolyl-tRNA editing enzyme YbaK/EbsC (Cys-tRNA(Pro) deacylase)
MRQKVMDAARRLGLDVDVTTLDAPTRTVQEAAQSVGCENGQIAKSIVFVADGDPVVVVASGAHRVDLNLLCEAIDCAEARSASPDEVRVATGFPVGGVCPFGHELPVIFDEALLEYDCVWAAGGDGNTVFKVDPHVLCDRIGARVARVAARA